jgi:TusE/DsrC/DsvC family sulfur relay protein
MAYEYDGKTIETNENGYLNNLEDWSEGLAQVIANEEGLGELTEKHWDIINYLRDEYINNAQNQPNERTILKAMSDKWGGKVIQKDTFSLFPLMPSKQGGKVAGLPESRRKGGY